MCTWAIDAQVLRILRYIRPACVLSMRHIHTIPWRMQVSGKPVKFVGVGEKMDALEPFYPERMASRILGMGDVLTLFEKAQSVINVRGGEGRGGECGSRRRCTLSYIAPPHITVLCRTLQHRTSQCFAVHCNTTHHSALP